MIEYEEEDYRTFVVESAIKNELGTPKEIQLYQQLSLALELMGDENFKVIDSGIGNGIDFGIATNFPHGLPDDVGIMFFNIDLEYDVSIKETSKLVYNGERHFAINIQSVSK